MRVVDRPCTDHAVYQLFTDFGITNRIFCHSSYFICCLVYAFVDIVRLSPLLSVPSMYHLTYIVGREESIVDVGSKDTAPTPSLAYRTQDTLCFDCRRTPSTRVWSSSAAAASPSALSALLFAPFFTVLFARRSPVHRCPQGLGAEGQPACLLNHGLVQWRRWAVDMDYVLFTMRVMGIESSEIAQGRRRRRRTFSRSIFASAPIRMSRIRFTIHFSPSSCERLSRAERSLSRISE